MPADSARSSYTDASGPDRVLTAHPERRPSGGSTVARSHRSPPSSSGSRSYRSGSGGSDSWTDLGAEDDIDPSDSASRSRPPSTRRHDSGSRPAPKRRHSSRRSVLREGGDEELEPRRRHSSRRHHSSRSTHSSRHEGSRRLPSDESSSTVASQDDYPYSHHGRYPQPAGYRNVPPAPVPPPSHGGYPPSVSAAPGYPDPYAAHHALVHLPHDAYGYPQPNPFSPMASSTTSSSYFASEPFAPQLPPHHRPAPAPRPQSFVAPASHYGSEVMSPYMHPGMMPYGPYGMMSGMPGYPPMPPWYPHLANQPSPAPAPAAANEEKSNGKKEEIEALKALIQQHEEARVTREIAALKKLEAEAAAFAAAKAKDEEEKKKTAEIAAATKKAKEEAEKKAEDAAKKLAEEQAAAAKKLAEEQAAAAKKMAEEHQKKLKEAQTAKEEAEKKAKEVEAENAKLKPAPDMGKQIKFKDAVGRKFSFPFHLCKTWKGMEGLIRQAFLHVDVIGDHVRAGHYDLMGPDGEIILPQVWDACVQPDWEISMHMWPEEKKEEKPVDMLADPFAALNFADILGAAGHPPDVGKKSSKKKGSTKKDKHPELVMPPPPPPPMGFPPLGFPPGMAGVPNDPLAGIFGPPPGVILPPVVGKKDKPKTSKSKKKESSGFGWFSGPTKKKK